LLSSGTSFRPKRALADACDCSREIVGAPLIDDIDVVPIGTSLSGCSNFFAEPP
jgi:hypothetical protein